MNEHDHMMERMASVERRLEAHDRQVAVIHTLVSEIHKAVSLGVPDSQKHAVDHEFLKVLKEREARRVKLWESVVEKVTGVVVIAVGLALVGALGRLALDAMAKATGGHG